VISLNLVLAGLRLGLKNRQVGEKWVSDDCSYLYKGLLNETEREIIRVVRTLTWLALECELVFAFMW
jgi:hypothetical protein